MSHIQKQYRLPSEAMKWLHLAITLLSHHADLVVHLQLSAVALLSCRDNVATQTKRKKKIEPGTNLQGPVTILLLPFKLLLYIASYISHSDAPVPNATTYVTCREA